MQEQTLTLHHGSGWALTDRFCLWCFGLRIIGSFQQQMLPPQVKQSSPIANWVSVSKKSVNTNKYTVNINEVSNIPHINMDKFNAYVRTLQQFCRWTCFHCGCDALWTASHPARHAFCIILYVSRIFCQIFNCPIPATDRHQVLNLEHSANRYTTAPHSMYKHI